MVANTEKPFYCILLGAPGAGKGTQAALLSQDLGLPRISSGDLFRENIRNATPLGCQAKAYLDRGELVPDAITVAMVLERLGEPDCVFGAILDGFPRTLPQAEALEEALESVGRRIGAVIDLEVRPETLISRLTGRWMCPDCGASYHVTLNPPKVAGRCDDCETRLYQRRDDCPETVANRLEVYTRQTAPLLKFYDERGVLEVVDGEQPIDRVQRAVLAILEEGEAEEVFAPRLPVLERNFQSAD